jgi:hypothetical protein
MRAHLELCLARAAARCGSLAGAKSLASFLDDKHSFFRKHARQELAEIFGFDKGSPRAWLRWLGSKPAWSPKPFIGSKRLL